MFNIRSHRIRESLVEHGLLSSSGPVGTDLWQAPPDEEETSLLIDLRNEIFEQAWSSIDLGKLQSALSHWRLFREELPHRLPVMAVDAGNRVAASRDNEQTLALFAQSVRRRGSLRPGQIGEPIRGDTISAYTSLIEAALRLDKGADLVDATCKVLRPRLFKAFRRADPPPGERRLRLGLRGSDFRELASDPTWDRSRSHYAILRWSVL